MRFMKLLPLTVAVALLPLVGFAQTTVTPTFTNNDGTFTFDQNPGDATYNALSLGPISGTGPGGAFSNFGNPGQLTAIGGLSAAPFNIPDQSVAWPACGTSCLGTITLTTGTLATGYTIADLQSNVFGHSALFNPGGTFMVSYTGLTGGTVSFSGTFANASWTNTGTNTWQFTGNVGNGVLTINGTMYYIPQTVTIQLTTTGAGFVNHPNKGVTSFQDHGGTTNGTFTVAPEPGTLTLFGSGLVALGVFARRRLTGRPTVSQD